MYFNNRNYQGFYGGGCTFLGCFLMLIVASFVIRGSMFLFFRYFWVILLAAVIYYIYREFVSSDNNSNDGSHRTGKQDWNRDYENRSGTNYHNVDRDFEEVDEDENEEDEFSDF